MPKWEWVDPDGAVYPLDGTWVLQALFGIEGHYSGPIQYLEQALPMDDGSQVTEVFVGPGDITIPWDMVASSEAEMNAWLDEAEWAFAPWRGQGKLRVHRNDGSGVVREYTCFLKAGFNTLRQDVSNGFAANAPRHSLVFHGGPFWEDASPITVPLDTESGTGTFLPVAFPWYLASSTVFATHSFVNTGHKEVWPDIYVRGPGSGFLMTNGSNGDYFGVDYEIDAGDAIQIVTRRPGERRVYLESTGQDLMAVTSGDMFALPTGTSQLVFELGGADSDSLIQLQAWRRWTGP